MRIALRSGEKCGYSRKIVWGGSRENMTEDRKKKWRTGYQAVPAVICLICLICLAGGLPFLYGKAEEEKRKYALDPMPWITYDDSTGSASEQFLNTGAGARSEERRVGKEC